MINARDKGELTNNFKNARLLVVEDNDDHWTLIQRAIAEVLPEIKPIRAANQQQAHQLLRSWSQDEWEMPRMVLLDLYLPEREQGWQVLEAVKCLMPPYNLLPVVVLSSSADQDDISEAYSQGVSAYVVKPMAFPDWLTYFRQLRVYWWETVTLPSARPTFFF